ncbi:hypothetical protein ACKVMT_09450 [Halobacteriales archaeon Cl-PHB]
MSSASPFRSDSAASTQQRMVEQPLRGAATALQFAGFWAAVILPFVLLSFVATGLAADNPTVAGGLLVGNLAGLALGRNYNR